MGPLSFSGYFSLDTDLKGWNRRKKPKQFKARKKPKGKKKVR